MLPDFAWARSRTADWASQMAPSRHGLPGRMSAGRTRRRATA